MSNKYPIEVATESISKNNLLNTTLKHFMQNNLFNGVYAKVQVNKIYFYSIDTDELKYYAEFRNEQLDISGQTDYIN